MKTRKRISLTIGICLSIAVVLSLGNYAHAGLVNGSFESSPDFTGWTTNVFGGTLDLQTSSGAWIPCTVTFNSGAYNQVYLYIGAYGTPTGRCWFDNVVPNGFSVNNPSFETANGNYIAGWSQDGVGLLTYSSAEHASNGSRSVMFSDPAFAATMIRMSQRVNVTPNTNYSYTFDFYMEDSFNGAIRCSVLSSDGSYTLGGLTSPDIDQLIADRSSFGNKTCRMALTGGQASVLQTVTATNGMHMEAVAYVKRKNLTGTVTLYVENAQTGAAIASVAATASDNVWQPLNVRFVSPSTQIRVRLLASGTGTVLVDGMSLGTPVLSPPPQMITWKPASDDFVLPSTLGYTISGSYNNVLTTGIGMLRGDLAAKSITLGQAGSQPTLIRIHTNIGDSSRPESYHLSVGPSGIIIEAPTERGAFYGIMTILQLISTNASGQKVIIGCDIDDWPDLPSRSLSRGISALTADWMARHKLNMAFNLKYPDIADMRNHGLTPVPHDNITHQQHDWGWWDPNLCEGVAGHDVFTLPTGVKRSLTGHNVINRAASPGVEMPIALVNPSFEAPSLAPGSNSNVIPTGWSMLNYTVGWEAVINGDAGAYCEGGGVHLNAQDGAQSVGMYSPSSMIMMLYQNTGVQIQAGVTYTASAYAAFGNAAHVGLGYADTSTGAYNGTALSTNITTSMTNSWQQFTTSGSLAADDPNVGKYLVVYLRAFGWTGFDNVTVFSMDAGVQGSIKVRNSDGTVTYSEGVDYILIPGVTAFPYVPTAAPYQIERKSGGAIADGQTVQVDYEYVPDYSEFVLSLGEMGAQDQMVDWAGNLVGQYNLDYVGLHVSEEPATIGKGPRSQATGMSAPQLMANYYQKLDNSVKQAKSSCKIVGYADDFMSWQNAPRSGLGGTAPLLPDDMILNCWWYEASGSVDFNKQSAELWTSLGHEFLLMGWYDYLNIHITAAAARWALHKGMPCLGLSSWAYNPDNSTTISPWMIETANCAWRVPRPGEDGYFDFEGAADGTHRQSQLGTVSMHIQLGDFIGDKVSKPVTVELLKDGVVRRQSVVTLGVENDFIFADVAPDTYDVRLSAGNFLRRVVPVVVPIAGTGTITVTLLNGDVNGDNTVTETDSTGVIANLGQTGAVTGDLDGDNEVTVTDLSIVLKNMGLSGE